MFKELGPCRPCEVDPELRALEGNLLHDLEAAQQIVAAGDRRVERGLGGHRPAVGGPPDAVGSKVFTHHNQAVPKEFTATP